tara:strand:- start:7222 stop:7752 length:531 start_codon:yes stop_codon:yes gene_type:complete
VNDKNSLVGDEEILGLDVGAAILQAAQMQIRRTDQDLLAVRIDSQEFDDVSVRRAFPLEAADRYIGFFDSDGNELGILEDPEGLEADSRAALDQQLALTYFLPKITDVTHIGEEFGVVHADVETTSGARQIEIRGIRSSIRVLSRNRALVEDAEGNRYELSDFRLLSKLTREILGL